MNQRSNCQHSPHYEKSKGFQKNICCFFTDYTKAIDGVDHNKLWKILKEIGMPDNLIFLLTNLYAGQEASVRIRLGATNRFKIGKRERQSCILSPCLFNFYAECFIWNADLDDTQAGIKIAKRNINNLRYAHRITLMVENEEDLKSPWWGWKRRVKKLS